jgi:putative endopeptidase
LKAGDSFWVGKQVVLYCTVLLVLSHAPAATPDNLHGIALGDMDRSVKPGDDFYRFANGGWIGRTEIPPDRASVSAFSMLEDVNDQRTASLIEEIGKSPGEEGSGRRKIRDLYESFMDEAEIERKGLDPLKPQLAEIAALKDKRELAILLGKNLRADVDPLNNTNFYTPNLFGLWVAPGFNDSSHYTAYLLEGGLEMPSREYYLESNDHMRKLQAEYRTHVAAMLRLAGLDDVDNRATRIVELERAIAQKHSSLTEDEDIHRANNSWNQSEFSSKAPGLDWQAYFQGAGLNEVERFIVWQPGGISGESALVASLGLGSWKDWLSYHLLESYATVLPKAFSDESFAFFGQALSGTPQNRSRSQLAVALVNRRLGDELGKLYVERYFPPQAKARAQQMVANVIAAFHKRIAALAWMNEQTKAEAQRKLSGLYVGIGYPEVWRDYSGYRVEENDSFGNLWRGRWFEYQHQVSRLGKAVDRQEWAMTPQTVNAVNLPLQNAINFPAAILEPPFFDPQAPDADNYGAIGTVIGHEISHTFDSEGSAFDATGAVRNWWTATDLRHFQDSTAQLARQFDQYQPFPDLHVNGAQTLAENIADLAGLAAAYDGYRAEIGTRAVAMVGGFSGDQQFFIAYAQYHRFKAREAGLRQRVMTDSHAPGEYRTDTVRNLEAWYESFYVQPGQKLYLAPSERVQIW